MTMLPMLASPSTGSGNRAPVDVSTLVDSGDWVLDVKLDGVRAFAHYDPDGTVALVNRNGVDITRKYPELQVQAGALGPEALWLDGEIVAADGRFETTLTRDKQESAPAIRRMSQEHPVHFIAFDLILVGETELHREPWGVRRRQLDEVAMKAGTRYSRSVWSDSTDLIERTRELGMEGVIAKRRAARYQFGRRSRDWVKHKHLHRISCLVSGYAPGNGSRLEFGAMSLALVGGSGDIVPVGTVGAGFRRADIRDLKARLDRAEVLVVEVECLNVTSGGQLRFPVYKGIRSDLSPLDCTTDQLTTLPIC